MSPPKGSILTARYKAMVCAAAVLVLLLSGVIWNIFGVSNQELLANHAKAVDFWRTLVGSGFQNWWSLDFLGGTSMAPSLAVALTYCWILFWDLVTGDPVFGGRVGMLVLVLLAGCTGYRFVKEWLRESDVALTAAWLYAFSPGVWIRMIAVEHVVFLSAFAVLPLVFLGALRFARGPSFGSALFFSVSGAVLLLVYAKAAALCFPVLAVFWLGVSLQAGTLREQFQIRCLSAIVVPLFLLGILPLLPSVREAGLSIFFALSPFEGWQEAFSTKSAFQLLDRFGELSRGYAPVFAPSTAAGAFYLGSVGVVALVLGWVFGRGSWDRGELGRLRAIVAMATFCLWLSFGPASALVRHFQALAQSVNGMNFTVVLLWGAVVAVSAGVVFAVPGRGPLRLVIAGVALLVYWLVPGFLFLSWVPGFRDLRAPFDLYQIPAVLFVAAGCAAVLCHSWKKLPSRVTRAAVGLLLVVVFVWDLVGFAELAGQRTVEEGAWEEFQEVCEFLENEESAGSVLVLSGRYFYLQLPAMAGRPLASEAFLMYLQARGMAALQSAGWAFPRVAPAAFALSGARYVLVDVEDSAAALAPEFADGLVPVDRWNSEGRRFVLYEIPGALAPGFLARDIVQVKDPGFAWYPTMLRLRSLNLLSLEDPTLNHLETHFAGQILEGEPVLEERFVRDGGRAFLPLSGVKKDVAGTPEIAFSRIPGDGWVVMTSAWHPDWGAVVNGERVPVRRAMGALPAVWAEAGSDVVFAFRAPRWYSIVVWVSLISWLLLPVVFWKVRRSKFPITERVGGEVAT